MIKCQFTCIIQNDSFIHLFQFIEIGASVRQAEQGVRESDEASRNREAVARQLLPSRILWTGELDVLFVVVWRLIPFLK